MNVELTDREREVIINALREGSAALTGYVNWIDDKPMLPQTEVAIRRVKDESLEMLRLSLKLMEAK